MSGVSALASPATWPLYPVLPLIRRISRRPELGFLVAGAGPIVFKGNVLDAFPCIDLSLFASTEYETLEAVLDDGWMVD